MTTCEAKPRADLSQTAGVRRSASPNSSRNAHGGKAKSKNKETECHLKETSAAAAKPGAAFPRAARQHLLPRGPRADAPGRPGAPVPRPGGRRARATRAGPRAAGRTPSSGSLRPRTYHLCGPPSTFTSPKTSTRHPGITPRHRHQRQEENPDGRDS